MLSQMETQVPPIETPDQRDIQENKDVAAFSYVWIMSVIIFGLRRDSKFIRYHSKQGIVLFIMSILVAMLPYVGRYLVFLVVAGMLLGFLHAAQGQYADVPFAGKLAKGELTLADVLKQIQTALSAVLQTLKAVFKTTAKPEEKTSETPVSPPSVPVSPPSVMDATASNSEEPPASLMAPSQPPGPREMPPVSPWAEASPPPPSRLQ